MNKATFEAKAKAATADAHKQLQVMREALQKEATACFMRGDTLSGYRLQQRADTLLQTIRASFSSDRGLRDRLEGILRAGGGYEKM